MTWYVLMFVGLVVLALVGGGAADHGRESLAAALEEDEDR